MNIFQRARREVSLRLQRFTPEQRMGALLMTDAYLGDAKGVREWLTKGANPDADLAGVPPQSYGEPQLSLLQAAASAPIKPEILEDILDYSKDIDRVGPGGMTAVHFAALSGQDENLEILHRQGADIHARSADGAGAHEIATAAGYKGLAKRIELLQAQTPARETAAEKEGVEGAGPTRRMRAHADLVRATIQPGYDAKIEARNERVRAAAERKAAAMDARWQAEAAATSRRDAERGAAR